MNQGISSKPRAAVKPGQRPQIRPELLPLASGQRIGVGPGCRHAVNSAARTRGRKRRQDDRAAIPGFGISGFVAAFWCAAEWRDTFLPVSIPERLVTGTEAWVIIAKIDRGWRGGSVRRHRRIPPWPQPPRPAWRSGLGAPWPSGGPGCRPTRRAPGAGYPLRVATSEATGATAWAISLRRLEWNDLPPKGGPVSK